MKKVKLEKVNLTELSNFISKLTPLNDTSTVFFSIDNNYIYTDSHNESATLIKSLRNEIGNICEVNNLTEKVKLCFYDGRKVVRALSFLNGNSVNCEIHYDLIDGENYAKVLKISSQKMTISLDAADPSLIEFANVPEDAVKSLFDTANTNISFGITSNELLQLHKMLDFDSSNEVNIKISNDIKISCGNSFELSVDDTFEGIADKKVFKISKDLFKLIDETNYNIFVNEEDFRIVLKSVDKKLNLVVTLNEDVNV